MLVWSNKRRGRGTHAVLFLPVYPTSKQQQNIVYSFSYFIKTNKTLFNVVKVLLCVHVAMFL